MDDNASKCGAGNRSSLYTKNIVVPSSVFSTIAPLATLTEIVALGCYNEPVVGDRALTSNAIFLDLMTVEKCAAACAGYKSFGLEYYYEFYCGNNINTGSGEVASTECSFPCTGDSTQTCGGGYRPNTYTIWELTSSSTAAALPTLTLTSNSAYRPYGCYTEATDQRALTGGSFYNDFLTIAKCEAVYSEYKFLELNMDGNVTAGMLLTLEVFWIIFLRNALLDA
ncbi:uncharacterized protein BP5553_08896 [Venustampulla echinocandica]|uniref:WSC domain-containing protein n=1 Tax=Venustampulla echinocandica TaxID=2656787 RepID=A0A370TD95_9HELO|nr:uncharacterized protein BP5553_08896 [Venustampulla echinocandica]RDL32440.1 hypothetical protein BP5553_08896 [Venustampulla echinocandica]